MSSQLYYNRVINPTGKNKKFSIDEVDRISQKLCSQYDADADLVRSQSTLGTLYRVRVQNSKGMNATRIKWLEITLLHYAYQHALRLLIERLVIRRPLSI